jgi:hypothetical protein
MFLSLDETTTSQIESTTSLIETTTQIGEGWLPWIVLIIHFIKSVCRTINGGHNHGTNINITKIAC